MRLRQPLATMLALATLVPLASCGTSNMEAMHEGHVTGDRAEEQMMHSGHGMDLGPADATYDLRFIDGMIPHHEGAVVMAEAALENSQRPEIRQLAEDIIAAQRVEIAQMKDWRAEWYPDAPAEPMMYHAEMQHDMAMSEEMISSMRMDMDLGGADEEFDLRFINAMIPHHEGAVAMAEDLKEKSDRPELQALADEIIASQQAEIDQMEQWRQDWYGQ
ncbi:MULTISPECIES: DUF305 domain-containing protein [Cyanophyceae]|uniref:DUF305 domain-containing protein n=1 Tax=Cyanophyceae TaxID=3028117 RepID=UPI001688C4A2|nr:MULTISPECIES: DUF305 domain-containing protein [Cyanophyceae]MBD1918534.1 DUF305 domain-containing protein [Phormidium sp. FACHB-77]MBD2031423.1 DUF305 domain-containing protein [Phormidium sp. FACHB-322]MBD2049542.1 DUF305 domain-containing protein [Leptolyngbya sp. FACHB-60]